MEMEDFCARFTSLLVSSRTSVDDLFRAAFAGDLAPFQHLVEGFKSDEEFVKIALGVGNRDGKTALHFAAAGGRKKVCKFLLEEGKLDVNMKDWETGRTPLHHAIKEERFPMTAFLLQNGADPNARTKTGRTPLHYAAKYGPLKLIRLLISKGSEVNAMADCGTPLQVAAGEGKQDFVKVLLDNHANANMISHNLFSPLLATIRSKSIECMNLLLKAGADPNFCGSEGRTPLGYAASKGSTEMIKCLLNAGADPNVANNLGMTPLEEAALSVRRWVANILFPLTSPVPTIPEWSISGLFKQVHSDKAKEERKQKVEELFLLSKSKGAESFDSGDYFGAVQWYTEAIVYVPVDADALSKRSLCWVMMNEGGLVLEDAKDCIKLRPTWPEAYYREGAAHMSLKEFEKAVDSFRHGCNLDPEDEELECALREAIEAQPKKTAFYPACSA